LKHRQDRWNSFLQKLQRSLGNRGNQLQTTIDHGA
jgi:hypothetical protein